MAQTIKIQIKSVYGVDKIYPACPISAIFASMLNTKTLTDDAMRHIKRLGYAIEIVHPLVSFAA